MMSHRMGSFFALASQGKQDSGLIKNEHRTSNIERPTSNNVFYQFKKKTEQSESTLRNSIRLSSPQAAVCLI